MKRQYKDDDVVVASACRTPIGAFLGMLSTVPAVRLGSLVVGEAIRRAGVAPEQVQEVTMGSVLTAGLGQNIARQIALGAGLPVSVPAQTLNMVCGSGMMSLIAAVRAMRCGDVEIVVAGGVENMSLAAYVLPTGRSGQRLGPAPLLDSVVTDGLTDASRQIHMGITAENIASRCNLGRAELDRFACLSQNRAEAAITGNRFCDEIVPVTIPQKKGPPTIMERDEQPRFGTTIQALATLKPAFQTDGVVTAGNSSAINDGAAAVVLMTGGKARELGLSPLARIRSYGLGGVEPENMGLGPIPATRQALARASVGVSDVELFEANEAFAAQYVAVARELGFPEDRTNVNGGAIALGHPIGASGTRIVVTLLYEMAKRDSSLGLATLCIGGGMGATLILER